MRYSVLVIFSFYLLFDINAQIIEIVGFQTKPDYSKNCEVLNNCYDFIDIKGDTLILEILAQHNTISDSLTWKTASIMKDTLYLKYESRQIIDTIIDFNNKHQKFDTLLFLSHSIVGFNDYFTRISYQIKGFSEKPDVIYLNDKQIDDCPINNLSYMLINDDTLNVINSNGWKHGKWISKYNSDSIPALKIKYYNNSQLIGGFVITERNDTIYKISETNIELLFPYK
jgi:hypothetical protein